MEMYLTRMAVRHASAKNLVKSVINAKLITTVERDYHVATANAVCNTSEVWKIFDDTAKLTFKATIGITVIYFQYFPFIACGPVCLIFCINGNVPDSNGCPTCKCKPLRKFGEDCNNKNGKCEEGLYCTNGKCGMSLNT